MSHYTKMSISAQQEYEGELIAALKQHFGEKEVEVHDKKASLQMWEGSPSGLNANLIVRRKNLSKKLGHDVLSNDLGYERDNAGGYTVHADEAGFPKESADAVALAYSEKLAERVFVQNMGYSAAERTVLPNGDVEVVYESYT